MGASTVSIAGSQVKEVSFLRHSHLPVFRAHVFHVFREECCTNKHLCALINTKITTVVKLHLILGIAEKLNIFLF